MQKIRRLHHTLLHWIKVLPLTRHMTIMVTLLIMTGMMTLACQDKGNRSGNDFNDFADATGEDVEIDRNSGKGSNSGGKTHQETFTVTSEQPSNAESQRGNVEMLWLLDNSASMREHLDSIKVGFDSFLKSLDTNVFLSKMAIVSCYGESQDAICFDELKLKTTDHVIPIIPTFINSNSALYAAVNLLCNKQSVTECREATGFDKGERAAVCDDTENCQHLEHETYTWESYWEVRERHEMLLGILTHFFSANSTKVVVVVSDGDRSLVTDTQFLKFWQANGLTKDSLKFYAITPTNSTYSQLAETTGGNTFTLESDTLWEEKFNDLATSIQSLPRTGTAKKLKTTFQLAKKAFKVKSLTINGKTISGALRELVIKESKFTEITIDPNFVQEGSKIVITYLH
ncbi:MAG: hypothetical protein OXC40_06575 [Proteobacteria bacterium]|nr:hypothetical protein [Pseudomonadota bacterium]